MTRTYPRNPNAAELLDRLHKPDLIWLLDALPTVRPPNVRLQHADDLRQCVRQALKAGGAVGERAADLVSIAVDAAGQEGRL